jgi:hypothetical protein
MFFKTCIRCEFRGKIHYSHTARHDVNQDHAPSSVLKGSYMQDGLENLALKIFFLLAWLMLIKLIAEKESAASVPRS